VQELNVHGRFAQFWVETGEFLVAARARWFFQYFLACGEECLTPSRKTCSRDSQGARHHVESFPTEQTEDGLSLLPRGKPLNLLTWSTVLPRTLRILLIV
jgi:hypothetical protein